MRSAQRQIERIASNRTQVECLISALRGGQVSETGDLIAALVDLGRALDQAGIAYALIGGLAVGLYVSERRPTVGVDVAVATSIDLDRISGALEAKARRFLLLDALLRQHALDKCARIQRPAPERVPDSKLHLPRWNLYAERWGISSFPSNRRSDQRQIHGTLGRLRVASQRHLVGP
jgi:hypothetical protein